MNLALFRYPRLVGRHTGRARGWALAASDIEIVVGIPQALGGEPRPLDNIKPGQRVGLGQTKERLLERASEGLGPRQDEGRERGRELRAELIDGGHMEGRGCPIRGWGEVAITEHALEQGGALGRAGGGLTELIAEEGQPVDARREDNAAVAQHARRFDDDRRGVDDEVQHERDDRRIERAGLHRQILQTAAAYLDVVAALDKSGDRLTLFCVNRHVNRDFSTDISVDGFKPAAKAQVQTLYSDSIYDVNSEDEPDAVQPIDSTANVNGSKLRYTFRHESITRIEPRSKRQL